MKTNSVPSEVGLVRLPLWLVNWMASSPVRVMAGCLLLGAPMAWAETTPETKEEAKTKANAAAVSNAQAQAESLEKKLTGFGFAAGVAVLNLNGDRPVESVSVDTGNVVRVQSGSRMRAGMVLEAHWLARYGESVGSYASTEVSELRSTNPSAFDERGASVGGYLPKKSTGCVCFGPLAVVELGDDVIKSFGVGATVSFARYSIAGNGEVKMVGLPFNIGVIAFAQPEVQSVVGDYRDGQVVPAGTTVRLQKEERYGWGVVFSANF